MFIVIYSPLTPSRSSPVAVFDLSKKRFLANPLALGVNSTLEIDLVHHECYGYKACASNLAKLPRNSRGGIESNAIPVKLDTEALQIALKPTRSRKPGEPPQPLRGGLTAENRFHREKLITTDILERAALLRTEGHTWRLVAGALGVSFEALKTAQKRATAQAFAAEAPHV